MAEMAGKRDARVRRVGLLALAALAILGKQRVDVQLLDRVDHEPRNAAFRQPVTRRRRQQKALPTIRLLANRTHPLPTIEWRAEEFGSLESSAIHGSPVTQTLS